MGQRWKYCYFYKTGWNGIDTWDIEVSSMTGWGAKDPKFTIKTTIPGGRKKGLTRELAKIRRECEAGLTAKLKAAQAAS